MQAPESKAFTDKIEETLIGPVLLLALAMRETWCLHASASLYKGRLVAFLGESGSGKSTLAAFLDEPSSPGWQRVADDLMPVAWCDTYPEARPRYPQLKIGNQEQPSLKTPESIPLEAVYILERPEVGEIQSHIETTTSLEAVIAIIQNTISARLFEPGLLSKHMGFCIRMVKRISVRRLIYPRQCELLSEVRQALERHLDEQFNNI